MNTPITYHGTWWFPTEGLISPNRKHCKTLTGTLTYYGDKASVLELYFTPQDYEGVISTTNQPDVLFGETADGCKLSLFNARWISRQGWSSVVYEVEYIIEGIHLLSIEDSIISRVDIQYPNLVNWCHKSRIENKVLPNQDVVLTLDMHSREYLFESEIEDGVRIHTIPYLHYNFKRQGVYNFAINEDTVCCITFDNPKGLRESFGYIIEFSKFLSFAIYAKQSPTSIKLRLKDGRDVRVLFRIRESATPFPHNVIKFNQFSDKIPAMLAKWHEVYTELSPIVKLLFNNGNEDIYDTSNFVGLAQGLDGYFKRFVNKLDGKDTRKYKEGIEKLIKRLQDVDVVKVCNIDAEQLRDSRDKYTHLFPEGEKPNALEGDELLWLTHKCRVLLTCCILDCLGLTNEEINSCCKNSAVENIIDNIPFL